MKSLRWLVPIAILALLAALPFARMSPKPPSSHSNGRLAPCPDSPNCVCSQDERPSHHVDSLSYSGDPVTALSHLVGVIEREPRTSVVERSPGYLRVEFRSRIFRFVDDVEFLVNESRGVIEVRSASRTGYSDLGVNRRRVERIRHLFQGAAGKA